MPLQPSARAVAIDAELSIRVCESRIADNHIAVLLAELDDDRKLHREFGYASLVDYAVHRHGMEPRKAADLRRVGERLPELPAVNQAMADGLLDWTKVRSFAPHATPASEAAWIELAKTATSRELERAVKQRVGEFPPSHVGPEDPTEEIRVTYRMTRAEAEMVRTGLQWLRTTCGPGTEPIEDGAPLAMVVQRLLADADPENGPSPDRHRFLVEHRSDAPVEVDEPPSETCCDAEVVEIGAGPKRGHLSRTIPPATRRAVFHRDRYRCQVPGCSNRLWLDLHHVRFREHGGSNHETNIVVTCCVHHRLIHCGHLDVDCEKGGFRFTFPDGRRVGGRGRGGTTEARAP